MSHPAQRGAWVKPLVVSVVAGVVAYRLWPMGQLEDGGRECVISALLWLVSLRSFFHAFAGWDYASEMRRVKKLSQAPSAVHGKARLGERDDAEEAGMFEGEGVFLGRLRDRDLFYPGETHLMTIAPAGAGKGTCLVVPNLLKHPGSMIVTDPKGELCAMTARHRAELLGHRVVVLNPWREKLSRELGEDLGDAGFNPLSIVRPGPDVKDEAELVASLLVPGQPGMSESEDYFVDFGQTILAGVMLHMVSEGGREAITLPELRRRLMAPVEQLEELLAEMATSEAFGGVVGEYGGRLSATLINSPKEFSGGLSTAQKALRIYDSFGPLGAHVAGGSFDFQSVKQRPTTVYVIMPSDRAGTHAAWLNLVISIAIEMVGRDRTNRRVLFLLDEFANLGYLPGVLRAMAQYRGQGVQVWTLVQQISMLRRLYKEGWQEFVGLSELVNTFGVWEPETLKLVSEWIGNETVRDLSYTSRAAERFDGGRDVSVAANDRARAVMRPEEVRTMPEEEQLVFYRNLPAFQARKVSYLDEPALSALAAPNPYHRREVHVGA